MDASGHLGKGQGYQPLFSSVWEKLTTIEYYRRVYNFPVKTMKKKTSN